MKLTIFLLIALFTVSLAEPSCDLDSMCMSCDATTADKCTGCYNGVVATYGARFLASDSCAGKITDLTDCLVFYPKNASATVASQSTLQSPCWQCGNSKILNAVPGTGIDWGQNNVIVSSVDATWSCGDQALSNPSHANCAIQFQGLADANGTGTAGPVCLITNAGYCSGGTPVQDAQAMSACSSFTNCSTIINVWTTSTGAQECHDAETGYAVGSGGQAGVAFTTDTNCRKLLDATNCGTCTDGYWFGGSTCYMGSSLYFLSAAAFLAAWFF